MVDMPGLDGMAIYTIRDATTYLNYIIEKSAEAMSGKEMLMCQKQIASLETRANHFEELNREEK